jgi:CMP-N,N'-diacetyllegionaminic acid synthase
VTVLAVVPARGGSKGVPAKNIRPLAGEPLLVHTLRAAGAARLLDLVVVSTEDAEIAAVARAAGAEVVDRPSELATDTARTEPVLLHAVDAVVAAGRPEPEWVVTLEPTAPLRTAATIDRCVELALREQPGAVLTVTETRDVHGRREGDRFRPLIPGQPRRRQERRPLYRESGTVYVTRTSLLRRTGHVLGEPLLSVVVTEEEGIDINTLLDFDIAEAVMRARKGNECQRST